MVDFIKGTCPACGSTGLLFIGSGGYITCSLDRCPNPTAVSDLLNPPAASDLPKVSARIVWSCCRQPPETAPHRDGVCYPMGLPE